MNNRQSLVVSNSYFLANKGEEYLWQQEWGLAITQFLKAKTQCEPLFETQDKTIKTLIGRLHYSLGLAQVANALVSDSKAEVIGLLKVASENILTSSRYNPIVLSGIQHALEYISHLIMQFQQNNEEQISKDLCHLELTTFELRFLTKGWVAHQLEEFDKNRSVFSFKLSDHVGIKTLRKLYTSQYSDPFYFSEVEQNTLYRAISGFAPIAENKEKAFFSLFENRLFRLVGQGRHYVIPCRFFANYKDLSAATVTQLRNVIGAQYEAFGKLLVYLDTEGMLSEDLMGNVIALFQHENVYLHFKNIVSAIYHNHPNNFDSSVFFASCVPDMSSFPRGNLSQSCFDQYIENIKSISVLHNCKNRDDFHLYLVYLNLLTLVNKEQQMTNHKLKSTFQLINELHQFLGNEKFDTLLSAIIKNPTFHPHYVTIMGWGLQMGKESTQELNLLLSLIKNENDWETVRYRMADILLAAHQKKFPEKPLEQVINDFSKRNVDVEFLLPPEDLGLISEQYVKIKKKCDELIIAGTVHMKAALDQCIEKLKHDLNDQDSRLLLLAIIRVQIKLTFEVFPYNLQMLNVLALLLVPRRIAQIKTGEGKSTINAVLAAFYALIGRHVDIVTTSRDLAGRDSNKFKAFYVNLGLQSTHNAVDCGEVNYKAPIVYGTNFDFEFAYLRQEIGDGPLRRGDRQYDVVIVDEVDSMFIDMQNNKARIAKKDDRAHQENIYRDIWRWSCSNQVSKDVGGLSYYLKLRGYRAISIKKITIWYDSLCVAQEYKEGKEYIIKVDRNNKKSIKIVDYKNTGQISENSRWNNGLHSLLEAKHNLNIEPETLTTCSVSHIDYFNKYSVLLGLTGTIGTSTDRSELESLYKVSCYDSPSYRSSQKKALADYIGKNKLDAQFKIVELVKMQVQRGRPVLLLCETINESTQIFQRLKEIGTCVQIYNGLQAKSADDVLTLAGNPGAVTIATNTAGRGADIVVTPKAESNGGLHVIITFKTINMRVELQGFGRTGRQGRLGTYQYVLNEDDFTYDELRLGSPEKVIAAWKENRMIKCEVNSLKHMFDSEFVHLQFIMQQLFFCLPLHVKKMKVMEWAICKEDISEICDTFIAGQESSRKECLVKVCKRMNMLWTSHLRDQYTSDIKMSILHFAVLHKQEDALRWFIQYVKEITGLPMYKLYDGEGVCPQNRVLPGDKLYQLVWKESQWEDAPVSSRLRTHGIFRSKETSSQKEESKEGNLVSRMMKSVFH